MTSALAMQKLELRIQLLLQSSLHPHPLTMSLGRTGLKMPPTVL